MLASWIARAIAPLPVPVSPVINTGTLVVAIRSTMPSTRCIAALCDDEAVTCAPSALAQRRGLAAQRALGDRAAHEDHELVELERLGQVVIRAVADRLDRRIDRAVRGHHDHLGLGLRGADRVEQREAIELGHAQIGDDDIDVAGGHGLERGDRRTERGRGEPLIDEAVGERLGHRELVVDDDHARAS